MKKFIVVLVALSGLQSLMAMEIEVKRAKQDQLDLQLFDAIKSGKKIEAENAIAAGANVNRLGTGRATPLIWAAFRGHLDCIKLLLEKGAAIDHRDDDEMTALLWAATRGHENACKILLTQKADVHACNREGKSPLFGAARSGKVETVRLLLDSKADIDKQDDSGASPLIAAAFYGHTKACELLRDRGAKTELHLKKQVKGVAWNLARIEGHTSIVKLLTCGQKQCPTCKWYWSKGNSNKMVCQNNKDGYYAGCKTEWCWHCESEWGLLCNAHGSVQSIKSFVSDEFLSPRVWTLGIAQALLQLAKVKALGGAYESQLFDLYQFIAKLDSNGLSHGSLWDGISQFLSPQRWPKMGAQFLRQWMVGKGLSEIGEIYQLMIDSNLMSCIGARGRLTDEVLTKVFSSPDPLSNPNPLINLNDFSKVIGSERSKADVTPVAPPCTFHPDGYLDISKFDGHEIQQWTPNPQATLDDYKNNSVTFYKGKLCAKIHLGEYAEKIFSSADLFTELTVLDDFMETYRKIESELDWRDQLWYRKLTAVYGLSRKHRWHGKDQEHYLDTRRDCKNCFDDLKKELRELREELRKLELEETACSELMNISRKEFTSIAKKYASDIAISRKVCEGSVTAQGCRVMVHLEPICKTTQLNYPQDFSYDIKWDEYLHEMKGKDLPRWIIDYVDLKDKYIDIYSRLYGRDIKTHVGYWDEEGLWKVRSVEK